jgi:serine protease Do
MKKIFVSVIMLTAVLITTHTMAQQKNEHANEEIIISQNQKNPSKTIVVLDSNKITINGQPLEEYKGDVKIIKRKEVRRDVNNFSYTPANRLKINSFNDQRGFLGVLTDKNEKGALIKTVTKGSSAEKAGLKEQDIITKVGDKNITSPEDLAEAVRNNKAGEQITISYLRNNKKKTTKVVLGKRTEMEAFNFDWDKPSFNKGDFYFEMPGTERLKNLSKSFNFTYDQRPKLGMRIQDLEDTTGVKVINVEEGSAADKSGIKKDDIITSLNGQPVKSVDDIQSLLSNADNNSHFTLKGKRNNADVNFDVKIPKKLRTADF